MASLHAFVSPSHLMNVVGPKAGVLDLTGGRFLPATFTRKLGRCPIP